MTSEESIYLEAAKEIGRQEADAHYAALYALYLETVPEFLRCKDEEGTLRVRPPGFNSCATEFVYFMNLGEGYAQTFAVFEFDNKWALRNYVSQIALSEGGFEVRQQHSKNLPSAIFTSWEMWQESRPRRPLPALGTGSVQ